MELQVEGRNVEIRKSWQEKIDEEKARLDRHHPGLVHNLRVTVLGTASHKEGGYELQVVASVPNDTVVVKRKGENIKAVLGDAFDTLGLQLKELQRKRRQTVKVGDSAQESGIIEGVVKKLVPHESYGFITALDGREVYFHENALKDLKMDQMNEGDIVKFGESDGDKGPCASWVRSV
ncbi:MAG: HPF/RaiA family ribosome-associated protein [Proteobacteria bacterium]|nr:HPF/RaiA family ribosome-associated protein [Desulfobulbaceae bacterium]MBU4153669.1 HPF/RaiA family ribosome-associated protein [Pseudomonadota bacterium]